MKVILLERVLKLGTIGDVVNVKPGFARNFLLPQKKAAVATKNNIAYFESQKAVLEVENAKKRTEAEAFAGTVKGKELIIIRQAGEAGQLFGSVTARDITAALADKGITVDRKHVVIPAPIKSLGVSLVNVVLHADVTVQVTVSIGKSEDEAKAQLAASKTPAKQAKKGSGEQPDVEEPSTPADDQAA